MGKFWKKNRSLSIFTAAIFCLTISQEAFAQQAEAEKPVKTTIATKGGDWFTRLRALYVYPNDRSDPISTLPSAGVCVHPAWTGEFDFGYMFTKNLGSELILATTRHTIMGTGSLEGVEIGTVWLLPPTLTLQWRFLPEKRLQPYVGGGVNWTLFYGANCDLAKTSLSLNQSWGGAVQAGLDAFLDQNWFLNLDVKYIWINTTAHLSGATPGSVKVWIDPWVLGFGFGRKW